MLIISDYKDFYDTAIGYGGIDKSVVYKRKTVEINNSNIYSPEHNKYFKHFEPFKNNRILLNYHTRYPNLFYIYYYILLICGELHPFIELHKMTYNHQYNKKNDFYFYDFDSFKEFIQKKFVKKMKKYKYPSTKEFIKNINSFFTKFTNIDKIKMINYHVDVDSPIVCYNLTDNKIILNAKLSDYDFYKVIDAFQMYQKLEMFLSGVMVKDEKKIIQLDDKSLRDKKGFNDMSFKKEKEK